MPAPVPTPTDQQVEHAADIMMIGDEAALTLINGVSTQARSNAKWALTLGAITIWIDGLADEANDIKKVGSIEFFEKTVGYSRLAFRNRVRRRYGLTALVTEEGMALTAVSSLQWF